MKRRVVLVWHPDESLLGIYADTPAGREAAQALADVTRTEYTAYPGEVISSFRSRGMDSMADMLERRKLDPERVRTEIVEVLHSDGDWR